MVELAGTYETRFRSTDPFNSIKDDEKRKSMT